MVQRFLGLLVETWRHASPIWLGLWIGLSLFTGLLIALMWTRWGQSRPLRKCLALSLFAHMLLALYATTIHISTHLPPDLSSQWIQLTVADPDDVNTEQNESIEVATDAPSDAASREKTFAWEQTEIVDPAELSVVPAPVRPSDTSQTPQVPTPLEPDLAPEIATPTGEPDSAWEALESTTLQYELPPEKMTGAATVSLPAETERLDSPEPTESNPLNSARVEPSRVVADAEMNAPSITDPPVRIDPSELLTEEISPLTIESTPAASATVSKPTEPSPAETIAHPSTEVPAPSRPPQINTGLVAVPRRAVPDVNSDLQVNRITPVGIESRLLPRIDASIGEPAPPGNRNVFPPLYRNRQPLERAKAVEEHGGSEETETAVERALAWLASVQASDGRWDADQHGAGQENLVGGQNRRGAGARADTGVTGLATLAYLGGGYTQREGKYKSTVGKALDFLLSQQSAAGDLAGDADTYARMYCHGMALLALGEAYAMTKDDRLRTPLIRAVSFSVSAQDRSGGGWRYHPGDRGDTSQLGWQIMALKSAEQSGIPVPSQVWLGVNKFLGGVLHGEHNGLACYRPNEQTSRSMTAEALVCRQFLGIRRDDPACDEAGDYLLLELPGQRMNNLYYWYYGTLAMYQLQGRHWDRWNGALRTKLISTQVSSGAFAGSWDTDDLWGTHGGRVYTTAMGAMCLEVYYRYLPLYAGQGLASRWQPHRR